MKLFRSILLVVHFVLLFLLCGVLLNAYIPPKVFWGFSFLSLGFPLIMILYVIITFFWIFSWKKRAFLFMFAGLFFLNPTKRWLNYSSEKKETPNLKIVTFNVKSGKWGKNEIQNYINAQKADLVFLQESGPDYELDHLKTEETLQIICFYSKYKILDRKDIFKPLTEKDVTSQCEQIDIQIRGKIYRVFNVHLQSFGVVKDMVKLDGNGNEDEKKMKDLVKKLIPTFKVHQEEIQLIRKSVEESPYPVIVAGDFNAVPNSYEYYQMSKVLKDAFFETGKGSGTSFHDFKYPLRIDYIFTSETIKPIHYSVDHSAHLSDHFPVIASFKID